MNWLDIVLIIVLIIGFLYGLKTGLIGAAFMAIGVIVGWQFAGAITPGRKRSIWGDGVSKHS